MSSHSVVIVWATGKQSTVEFSSEAAARVWLDGQLDEIMRNRWSAFLQLRAGAEVLESLEVGLG